MSTHAEKMEMNDAQCAVNTDREIYRGPSPREWGDDDRYYADSIHVTENGGIGFNCGGHVIVMPLRKWFEAAQSVAYVEGLIADVRIVLRGFDEEVFIRDVAHDAKSDWAMKMLPYVAALGRLAALANDPNPSGVGIGVVSPVVGHEPGKADSTHHTARNCGSTAGESTDRGSGAPQPEGAGPDDPLAAQCPGCGKFSRGLQDCMHCGCFVPMFLEAADTSPEIVTAPADCAHEWQPSPTDRYRQVCRCGAVKRGPLLYDALGQPYIDGFYKLCWEIEKLLASEQQTKISTMASALHRKIADGTDEILSEWVSLIETIRAESGVGTEKP